MSKLQKHRNIITFGTTGVILLVALIAVFWARGFKPDFKTGRLNHTGLIVASSIPTGAQVYLNDRLTSATDTNIAFLDPKTYKVRIQKDGYNVWEKDIEIKADLATEIKAYLFPTAPQISPLTTTGAANPTLSPDGTKIAYGTAGERGGLYILGMNDRPFFFSSQDNRQVAKNQGVFDFTKAKFLWSGDSKQLIATFTNEQGQPTANLLIDTDKGQQDLMDITASLTSTLSAWQDDITQKAQTLALTAPQQIKSATEGALVANASPAPSPTPSPSPNVTPSPSPLALNYYPTGLIFSPDEEKVLYKNKAGKYQIYDLKTKKTSTLPDFSDFVNISWFPTSNHLVLAQKNLISIIEADGSNKMVIYSGRFEDSFVYSHPSGTRLVILTPLTQPDGTAPNLYAINLK